jgi:hypothetical protein
MDKEQRRVAQPLDRTIDIVLRDAAHSRIVDAHWRASSEAAIRSSKVLLETKDLGTVLPGFEVL